MRTKKSGKRKWMLLAVFLTVLAAAFLFRAKLFLAFVPDVSEISISSVTIEQDSVKLQMTMVITNPKLWTFTILEADIAVYDDSILLMRYHNHSARHFGRGESLQEKFELLIPIEQLQRQIRAHQGEDSVHLRIEGTLEFNSIAGIMSRSVNMEVAVVVPIPPTLRIVSTEYIGKTDGRYDLLLHIVLANENNRSLEMKEVSYYLSGEDLLDLSGYLASVSIAARDSTLIAVPVRLLLKNKAGIVARIILNKDIVHYNFVLKGTIVSLSGIIDEDVPVVIRTNGFVELYDRERTRKQKPKFSWRKKRKKK